MSYSTSTSPLFTISSSSSGFYSFNPDASTIELISILWKVSEKFMKSKSCNYHNAWWNETSFLFYDMIRDIHLPTIVFSGSYSSIFFNLLYKSIIISSFGSSFDTYLVIYSHAALILSTPFISLFASIINVWILLCVFINTSLQKLY